MIPVFYIKRGAKVAHIQCPLRRQFTVCGLPIERPLWEPGRVVPGRRELARCCVSCNRMKDADTIVSPDARRPRV